MTCKEKSVINNRKVLIDTLVLIKLLCFMVFLNHFVSIFQRGFFCGDESLMYPYKDDTINDDTLHGVGVGLPLLLILLMEWWHLRKDADDGYIWKFRVPTWLLAAYSTAVSFCIGMCIIEITATITKKTIGRLRPHFFDVCKPSVDCSLSEWQNRYIDAYEYTCTSGTSTQQTDMRKSFLSGHSIKAAYTMIYAIVYLERRKIQSSYFARHSVQFILLMMSWFTALSRVSDFKHHWSDVLAGYSVGTIMAIIMALWCTVLIEKTKRPTSNQQLAEISTKN